MSSPAGTSRPHVAVIGGGFSGLAAAWELGRRGLRATVLERDAEIGGLAGSFIAGGARLEKFYHHWFTNDVHVMELIEELGQSAEVLLRPTRTGTYHGHDLFKLSTPLDLLRFSPLPFPDRLRLGLLALRARRVKDWRALEDRSAADWLREMDSERVYRVVWEPLLRGKFGDLAEEVAAVWFWNKLKLRGGSRGRGGGERLAYYEGGFAALVVGWPRPSGARAEKSEPESRSSACGWTPGGRSGWSRPRRRWPPTPWSRRRRCPSSPTSWRLTRRAITRTACDASAIWPMSASCSSSTAACRTSTG